MTPQPGWQRKAQPGDGIEIYDRNWLLPRFPPGRASGGWGRAI